MIDKKRTKVNRVFHYIYIRIYNNNQNTQYSYVGHEIIFSKRPTSP